jgi:hypothetical protein
LGRPDEATAEPVLAVRGRRPLRGFSTTGLAVVAADTEVEEPPSVEELRAIFWLRVTTLLVVTVADLRGSSSFGERVDVAAAGRSFIDALDTDVDVRPAVVCVCCTRRAEPVSFSFATGAASFSFVRLGLSSLCIASERTLPMDVRPSVCLRDDLVVIRCEVAALMVVQEAASRAYRWFVSTKAYDSLEELIEVVQTTRQPQACITGHG